MEHSIENAKITNRKSRKSNLIFILLLALLISGLAFLPGCQSGQKAATITKTSFGQTTDGKAVDLYTIINSEGSEISITNYGGLYNHSKFLIKAGNWVISCLVTIRSVDTLKTTARILAPL